MTRTHHDPPVVAAWHLDGPAWVPWITWCTAIGLLALLASVRVTTSAEFAVTSLALLPVLLVTWMVGRHAGLLVAALATAMWLSADVVSNIHDLSSWVL
jgi:hypothetical protein